MKGLSAMQHIASIVTIIVMIANAVLPFGAVSSARSPQVVPAAEKVETTPEPASEAAAAGHWSAMSPMTINPG